MVKYHNRLALSLKENLFRPLKPGEAIKCFCYTWWKDESPSMWTGRIAIILENLNPEEQFLEEEPDVGIYSKEQWNHAIAKDIWYKVMIGKEIKKFNHLCFIKETLNWKTGRVDIPSAYL